MELKYDIYMLNNAQGTGEKRQYIRIVQHEPMTEKQLRGHLRASVRTRCPGREKLRRLARRLCLRRTALHGLRRED